MTGNPRRIRVQSPGYDAQEPAPASQPDDASNASDAYVRSLIRSQLRLAVVVGSGFLILLLGVPALVWLSPALAQLSILGVPLQWLLLGFLMYPIMITAAWLYTRSAQRNEERYRQLTDQQ